MPRSNPDTVRNDRQTILYKRLQIAVNILISYARGRNDQETIV